VFFNLKKSKNASIVHNNVSLRDIILGGKNSLLVS
jgi:hypothetical protein